MKTLLDNLRKAWHSFTTAVFRHVFESALFLFAVIFAIMIFASSCVAAPKMPVGSVSVPDTYQELIRVVDREAGVVCWVWKNTTYGGLSCLPLKDTKLLENSK